VIFDADLLFGAEPASSGIGDGDPCRVEVVGLEDGVQEP
jgi:hypothetical protein